MIVTPCPPTVLVCARHLRRNFSVKTDRWAAAVVAIDQLPRKIASVTDTKREKNAMSEDKINEEQSGATQTVANAQVDDSSFGVLL